MKLKIKAGTTSKRLAIFVTDASSTYGAGLSGLVHNALGLTAYYWREDDGNADGTAIALVDATRGTFTSGGFKAKDGTNMPGFYELGVPNAALAAGAKWVVIVLKGASNMVPVALEIQLMSYDPGESVEQTGDSYSRIGANGAGLTSVVAASVTGNVGGNVLGNVVGSIGAIANNAITAAAIASGAFTSTALAASFITAIAAGVWDRLTSALTTVGSIGKALVAMIDIHEGDEEIDKTTDPTQWQQVVKKKSTSTEVLRKKLYKSDGTTKVTSDEDIVGKRSES